MLTSKSASKGTIAKLIMNSGLAVDELYKALKVELAVRTLMDDHTPQLYFLTQELQNGVKFMLMDIGVLCRAELSVDNIYEKRFYLKNIQASISEGYKLIFNFGKLRKKSLWKKLMMKISEEENKELINESIEIDKNLEIFGNTEIDKELRDLTLHYDDEMIKVYQKTLSIDSEEKVMQTVCRFWKLLQDIILFTYKVDAYCLEATGIDKIYPSYKIREEINPFHQYVCDLINKDGKLTNIFKNLPKGVVESLDSMVKYWLSTKRIEEYAQTKVPTISVIPEIGNIQTLTNIQLLLRFMMLDLVAIVDAYIKSSSDIESALNLRRVCVIKVSTMVHLYGYTPDEHDHSIWRKLEEMIPNNSDSLKDAADEISLILSKIVINIHDKDLRTTFVHLFDNSQACTDIANVVSAIEGINPMEQIVEIQLLLEVYKRLMNFITNLMNVLSRNAHEDRLRSTKSINDKMDELIHKFEESRLPDELKKQMLYKILDMKNKINDM